METAKIDFYYTILTCTLIKMSTKVVSSFNGSKVETVTFFTWCSPNQNDIIQRHQMIIRKRYFQSLSSGEVYWKSIQNQCPGTNIYEGYVKDFWLKTIDLNLKFHVTGSHTDSLNSAQYFAVTFSDLFMINFLGQINLNQSVRVQEFIYEVPWYKSSRCMSYESFKLGEVIITVLFWWKPF